VVAITVTVTITISVLCHNEQNKKERIYFFTTGAKKSTSS